MSSNVGLSTPRGSGTSGYVQRNLSALHPNRKPTSRFAPYPQSSTETDALRHRPRQPDSKILAHDRARQIEVKIFELRDKLEEEAENGNEALTEEEIDKRCEELRMKLEKGGGKDGGKGGRDLKRFQVHELAAAKIEESEKLRRALGIRKDYEEGSHWKRGMGETEERLKRGLKEDDGERQKGKGEEQIRRRSRSYSGSDDDER